MFQRLDRSMTEESLATKIWFGVCLGIRDVTLASPNGSDSTAKGLICVRIKRGIPAFAALFKTALVQLCPVLIAKSIHSSEKLHS